MDNFVQSIWFEILVYGVAVALVILLCRYNPFIPGRIKNKWLRVILLAFGFIAVALAVIARLMEWR